MSILRQAQRFRLQPECECPMDQCYVFAHLGKIRLGSKYNRTGDMHIWEILTLALVFSF